MQRDKRTVLKEKHYVLFCVSFNMLREAPQKPVTQKQHGNLSSQEA